MDAVMILLTNLMMGGWHQSGAVRGRHEAVQLGGPRRGRGAQPLRPQPQRVHVWKLNLLDLLYLETLQVEVVNVEAFVCLHHGVGDADQAVQPRHRGHVGIQLEAGGGLFVGSLCSGQPLTQARIRTKMCLLEIFVTTGTGSAETNSADTALDPNCDGNAVLRFAEKSSLGLVPVSALGQQYLRSSELLRLC